MLGMVLMDSGRQEEAKCMFERLLKENPQDALALHNLGRIAQAAGEEEEAISLLQRAASAKQDLAPIYSDLAVSLHRTGLFVGALAALERALCIDPSFSTAHDNRGVVLYDLRRFKEAMDAHNLALHHAPNDVFRTLLYFARAACEEGELEAAEKACLAILQMDEKHADGIEQLARVMYRKGNNDGALHLLNRLARIQGLRKEGCTGASKATVLVLGGAGAMHLPTKHLFDPDVFSRLLLTMVSPEQTDAPLGGISWDELSSADAVFNAEKSGNQSGMVERVSEKLCIPLINSPERVARTGRNAAPELFGNIPGLRVPAARVYLRGEPTGEMKETHLARPMGTHGGEGLEMVSSEAELKAYLERTQGERFLLTEYCDFRDEAGNYRKYRFIFIDRKPYPYHLAISKNWLVHYWRTDMGHDLWKKQEEENFLSNWKSVFGARAAAAVEMAAERLDLDYGGMDCSLLPSGEVLFFEANACMLMQLEDKRPCKTMAAHAIRDAMTCMVEERIRNSDKNRQTSFRPCSLS
jgi:tetratricopeptide (TPR) repeat protein